MEIKLVKMEQEIKKDPHYFDKIYNQEDKEMREESLSYQNIAKKYMQEGNEKRAIKALNSKHVILMNTNKINANFYNNLSLLYYKLKIYREAFEYQKEASEMFLKIRNTLFKTLSVQEKQPFLEDKKYNLYSLLPITFDYLQQNPSNSKKIIQESFNLWLKAKGEITNTERYLMRLKARTQDKSLKFKIDELREVNKIYSKLFIQKISKENGTTKEFDSRLKKIEAQKRHLEQYLSSRLKEYSLSEYLTFDNIANHLKESELYIDFAQMGSDCYIFTVNQNREVTLNKISSNLGLNQLISEFRDKIIQKEDMKKISKTLYQNIFSQLNIQGYKKLIVSPDGSLTLLPFEALLTQNDKYLIEKKDILYVTSGKDFLQSKRERLPALANRDIVILTYLNYRANRDKKTTKNHSSSVTKRELTDLINDRALRRLKATKEELRFFKELFKESASIYTEQNGTKELLYSLNSPQILHLSTHSFYAKEKSSTIDPLLKAGVALSSYNSIFKDGDNRGLMSALEFSNLNLFNTELVFFASCQSGMGDIHSLEGIWGLNRGAKMAGAKRVIATIWNVNDKESVNLSKLFYSQLTKEASSNILGSLYRKKFHYAKALKESKLQMLNLPPYYWAGFIEYGVD
jgi:CHAT domain-containing protein